MSKSWFSTKKEERFDLSYFSKEEMSFKVKF